MKKIKLDIVGISYSQAQSGAYTLVLEESEGNRRLAIIIGGFEAQAIALELEKMKPARPLTHDLFKSFAEKMQVELLEVIITKFQEGVFFAGLICRDGTNVFEIDSRTSDAVALAVRFQCPIFTTEEVIAEAGMVMENDKGESPSEDEGIPEPDDDENLSELYALPDEELEKLLSQAIADEDFEKASQIRDEINRRKPKK